MDFGENNFPLSEPATATTGSINTDDLTPPTTPGNLRQSEQNWGDCGVEMDWDESTDDFDPQWLIEYEVYANDVYDHSTSQRFTRTIVYGTSPGKHLRGDRRRYRRGTSRTRPPHRELELQLLRRTRPLAEHLEIGAGGS